mgnify:CR=1 FL=1|jgi:ribose 5-phosphate isomerase B
MRIGIASDHGGYALKGPVIQALQSIGHEVVDFGADHLDPEDDYPDFVIPLAQAAASGQVDRGIAICGSGVGACVAANKVPGARAALVTDVFSAHQGVEDDNMNVMCLGARVIGYRLAWDLIRTFLSAKYKGLERFERRLAKISALEDGWRETRPAGQEHKQEDAG